MIEEKNRVRLVRRLIAVVLVGGAAVLVPSAGAWGDALPALFAGSWNTTYPPTIASGTLTLQSATNVSAAISAIAALGGPPTGCSAPTVYYTGSYTSGPSNSGQVAGCTTDLLGLALTAYYAGSSTGAHGDFSVSTSCGDPNRFGGTYNELSNDSTGNYAGTRTGGSAACSGSGGGGSGGGGGGSGPGGGGSGGGGSGGGSGNPGGPVTVTPIPAPSNWGQSTAEATLAAGTAIGAQSPPLAPSQTQATITAPLSQNDAMALVADHGARKPGDCVYVALAATIFGSGSTFGYGNPEPGPFGFLSAFQKCLSLLEPSAAPRAATSAASCQVAAVHVTNVKRKGGTFLTSTRSRKPPLIVSCARAQAGLVVHVRARHGSLRSIVGPRLQVGLYRSRGARASSAVRVRFAAR